MIDGVYDVTARTPLGAQRGKVTLARDGEGAALRATVELGGKTQTAEGTTDGSAFSFSGELKTPFGALTYELAGTADGSTLNAIATTRMGSFDISGTGI